MKKTKLGYIDITHTIITRQTLTTRQDVNIQTKRINITNYFLIIYIIYSKGVPSTAESTKHKNYVHKKENKTVTRLLLQNRLAVKIA